MIFGNKDQSYSATVFCNTHLINRNQFWESLIHKGYLTNNKTISEKGIEIGIAYASNDNGDKWPIYPITILPLLEDLVKNKADNQTKQNPVSIEAPVVSEKKETENSTKINLINYISKHKLETIQYDEQDLDEVFKSLQKKVKKEKPKQSIIDQVKNIKPDAKILVFDTETTGFNMYKDELLQITMTLGTLDHQEIALSSYVRPWKLVSWPEAEAINHITYNMVKYAPKTNELKARIVQLFESANFIIGHNVGFDAKFMKSKFGYEIKPWHMIDTLQLFKKLNPDAENHKLITAVSIYLPDRLEEFKAGAHDATTDTVFTGLVFNQMLEKIKTMDKVIDQNLEPELD